MSILFRAQLKLNSIVKGRSYSFKSLIFHFIQAGKKVSETSIVSEKGIKTGENDGNPHYKAELDQIAPPTSAGSLNSAPPSGKSQPKIKKETASRTGDDDGNPHYKAELEKGWI